VSTGPTGPIGSTATLPRPQRPQRPPAAAIGVLDTVAAYFSLLEAERAAGRSVGVVPTMGALHAGHRALIERAASECDVVAVTVFVNPTQFGDPRDLAAYPRDLDADVAIAAACGADVVFAPSVEEMYPDWPRPSATRVSVPGLARRWEGSSRPGHFEGVCTVVVKLLAATGRCRAYFGEKDFQQLAIVRRLVQDLLLPAQIVGCETVRCDDGLALSSRNAHLDDGQRTAALVLSQGLRAGAAAWAGGGTAASVEAEMARVVAGEPAVELDYAVLVDAEELEQVDGRSDRPLRLLIAATVGPVRLIDNLDPRRFG
jgi:pantoate--beta-alanine ligase